MTLYGARRGEVLGLTWPDIDLAAKTLRIGRARVLVGSKVIVKTPKSERGFRILPLDDVLVAALRALHTRQLEERLEAGPAYEPSGYVVVDELGVPVYPDGFSDEFHRLAALAGCPRIRLHDGRHTTNSLMAAAGVPDHIRAAWCGHTVAVNVATYTHARPEDLVSCLKTPESSTLDIPASFMLMGRFAGTGSSRRPESRDASACSTVIASAAVVVPGPPSLTVRSHRDTSRR